MLSFACISVLVRVGVRANVGSTLASEIAWHLKLCEAVVALGIVEWCQAASARLLASDFPHSSKQHSSEQQQKPLSLLHMPLLCNQVSAPTQLHDARAVGTISHSLQRDITLMHKLMGKPRCKISLKGVMLIDWLQAGVLGKVSVGFRWPSEAAMELGGESPCSTRRWQA